MSEIKKAVYAKESDLCADFVKHLPEGWTAYPETAGFDLLLVRAEDGAQIGVEAKLTLNAKVIDQIMESYEPCRAGPDFRAVLVPYGVGGSLIAVCEYVGITVIAMKDDALSNTYWGRYERFSPRLPEINDGYNYWYDKWFERAPDKRCTLPEYVPDVAAGASAPSTLSEWKIRAIKIAILVERRGYVCRSDFKHISIDHRIWVQPGARWLNPGPVRGAWVRGDFFPNFRAQHPINYEQIAADYEKWKPADPTIQLSLEDIEKKEVSE